MVKGKDTGMLPETLVQVMLGVGTPSAEQLSVTTSVSFTVWFPEIRVMSAGSGRRKYFRSI